MGTNTDLDYGGLDIIVNSVKVGATAPGQAGSTLSSTELGFLDGVTAGTAAASKALVLNSSSAITSGLTALTATTITPTTIAGATNFSSTPTFAVGATITGAVTISTTLGVTGVTTPTGGLAAAGGYAVSPRNMNTGGNPPSVSTDFSDYTVVVTETIRSEIFVPANTSSTGVAVFNGSAAAGNVTAYLIDSTGAQVTGVLTASTAMSGTDAYQRIPWSGGPYTIKGPATYWIALQGNNTGGKINTHTIGNFGADKQTGTTYGTLTVATAPSTFTTALGPVAALY